MIDFDTIIDRRNDSSYKWSLLKHFFGADDIIALTIAEMDLPLPNEVKNAMMKRMEHPIYGYTVKPDSFYNAIINWLKRKHNWSIKKEWVTTVPGVIPAINFAMHAFTDKGDGILVQPPVYTPFFESIALNERKLLVNNLIPKEISKNKITYNIDFNDFEEKVKQSKIFILCSPHNPVGRVWTLEELKTMGEICKKHNVLVIADEVHNDLVFEPHKHTIFASINDYFNNTITCISPSKTFNVAGLYSSIIIIPNNDIKKRFEMSMAKAGLATSIGNINMPPFSITIVESCFTECDQWHAELLQYLYQNRCYVIDYIENELPMLKVSDTEATFLSWIDFNALGLSHEDLIKFLVQKAKVGLDTGIKYEGNSSGYMRLNFGCSKILLNKALEQIKKAIIKI